MHQLRGARPLQPSNSAPASPANATRRRRPARSCRAYAAALWLHASDHISRHAGLDRRAHRHRIIILGEHLTGAFAKLRIHANLLNHVALAASTDSTAGRSCWVLCRSRTRELTTHFRAPAALRGHAQDRLLHRGNQHASRRFNAPTTDKWQQLYRQTPIQPGLIDLFANSRLYTNNHDMPR